MKGREGCDGDLAAGSKGVRGSWPASQLVGRVPHPSPRSLDCLPMAACTQGVESSSTEGSPREILREGRWLATPTASSIP